MTTGLHPAGFVLIGGNSSRMGQDKALLSYNGRTLAQHVAQQLNPVTGPVSLIGDPARYSHLGLPTIADATPGRGPLSGIEAALLSHRAREWNLIVACDMPRLRPEIFGQLAERALLAKPEIDCIVPRTHGRLQPLAALYRQRCSGPITRALSEGIRRVVDMVAMLQASTWDCAQTEQFQNVNTRPEWDAFLAESLHDR